MKPGIPREEMETIINVDYIDNVASVYSNYPSERKRLMRMAQAHPQEVKTTIDDGVGYCIEVPRSWIKVKSPVKRYTEEQKLQLAERMRKMRATKGDDTHAE